jgi:hypothetical protein
MNRFALLPTGLSEEFLRLGIGDTDEERLANGLMRRNILQQDEKLAELSDCTAWHQGGAETYIADSIVKVESKQSESRHVIAKALFSFGTQPEIQLRSWMKRRKIIAELNIRVPYLYSAANGTIYEEFIESELDPDCFTTQNLLRDLAQIAASIDHAGFTTLNFLSDLRRRNDKLFYIDFGFDLGDPGETTTDRARITLEQKLSEPYKKECLEYYKKFINDLCTKHPKP